MTAGPATSPDQAVRQPRDLRLLDAWKAVVSPGIKVLSTDVFDTLVWRTVPEPVDAFPLVAERLRERGQLAVALESASFGTLRRVAERRARHELGLRLGQTEVRLEEIYERLPPWVFGGSCAPGEAAQVELEVERELIVPDLDMVDLLLAAQDAGKRIVAVSDTYFSAKQLRGLLEQPLLARVQFDHVFTSSDHRTNKSGGLHAVMLRELGVEGGEVIHVGDHPVGDVDCAREEGIRAVLFERRPEPFASVDAKEARFRPSRLEGVRVQTLASGLTATRSKVLCRADLAAVPAVLRPHWNYGATVLGPVMAGFADWVLDVCERRGVRKLGCLMREGEFLAELIRRAALYRGCDVAAVPLWLNRSVCLRAAVVSTDLHDLRPLLDSRSALTVEGLLRRLGVGMSALPQWASHARTTLADPVVRVGLLDALASDPVVRGAIFSGARAQRERIVRLIDEFAGPAPASVAVVDLGWGATIQRLLGDVLRAAGAPRPLLGLYLMTHEGTAEQILEGIEAYGFLGDVGLPEEPVKLVLRSPELLEQVCMPEHGSQIELDDELRPVCAENGLPPLQRVEAEAVRNGIFAFQREWARYHDALPGKLPRLGAAARLLRPILLRSVVAPTADEVSAFSAWQHDENRGSDRVDLILDPSDVRRLRYMDPQQARDLPMSELYWPFGLAARVDEHWADLMAAAAAGQIEWDALAAPLETGTFRVDAEGIDVEPDTLVVAPKRNRLGLSAVTGTLRAAHISEVVIRPAEHPCLLRIDRIELRCWCQGEDEPLRLPIDGADGLERVRHANCFRLQPNVVIAHGSAPELRVALGDLTPRVIYRVDVEVAFAALAISQVLPAGGRFADLEDAARHVERLERSLSSIQRTASWRITAPLRRAKRLVS